MTAVEKDADVSAVADILIICQLCSLLAFNKFINYCWEEMM